MPVSPVGQRIATALTDKKISKKDAADIIATAKAQPKLTTTVKAELTALLSQPNSSFERKARTQLQRFVDASTFVAETTPTTTPTTTTTTPTTPSTPITPPAPAVTNLADPKVLDKHSTDVTWTPVAGGKLFVDDVSYDDVIQGSIGDCYLVGALSAVAKANPQAIKDAIKDNGDGTYNVRFYEKGNSGTMKPVTIKVDGDMPTSFGSVKYAKSRDTKELWVGILEKAYAQWKGGYEAIGNGGVSADVMSAIMGKNPGYTLNTAGTQDATFNSIKRWTESGRPVSAGTHGKDSGVDYTGSGVYAWHVYTVLGASEEAGVKYIQLRNPWGSTEPGSDGKNDGIFKMKLDDFTKWYRGVHYTLN